MTGQDYSRAAQCYERGLKDGIGCHNRLGALCFDGKGVPKDEERAVKLLTWAYEQGNKWGLVYLGKAYFYGRGVQKDYVRARQLLGDVTWSNQDASYMLGVMYAQGLGVDQDIRKGVEHLQKAGDLKEARDELAKYKKNLFGKWIRRK